MKFTKDDIHTMVIVTRSGGFFATLIDIYEDTHTVCVRTFGSRQLLEVHESQVELYYNKKEE